MSIETIVAISDIHGFKPAFDALYEKIQAQCDLETTQLVFLGDYIDRGAYSAQLIEEIRGIQTLYPQTVCLLGNHEEMCLNAFGVSDFRYFYSDWPSWWYQGGRETADSYEGDDALFRVHKAWMKDLSLFYETDDFIFVHAGLRPFTSKIEDTSPNDMLWIREEYLESDFNFFDKRVISGHTYQEMPLIKDNLMCIDTGYGSPSAVMLRPGDKACYQIIQ